MKKYIFNTVFILIFSTAFAQISSLDRETAKKLVIDFYLYPNHFNIKIPLDAMPGRANQYKNLIDKDYLRIDKSNQWEWKFAFTQRSNKYVLQQPNIISLGTRDFNKIEGIKIISPTEREIEFSCILTNVNLFSTEALYYEGKLLTYKVNAALYDDGWRITSPRGDIYPIEK